ncbi:MAG: hypothetical protein GY808_06125 [Gammaproteobacteria bacterium]|nr:hypothetical protein [Gammaproteobacteria bacterium]
MKHLVTQQGQQGVTLVVAILFLLILTILSVFAATNSSLEFKMAGNMQDSYASFQSAEAGAIGTLALSDTANDPFDGLPTEEPLHPNDTDTEPGWDPFFSWADTANDHPLKGVYGTPAAVDVTLHLTTSATICPRAVAGYSVNLLACDHYDIESRHSEAQKATTEVHLGAVKTFIGAATQ